MIAALGPIAALWRYPVKSLRGEGLSSLVLDGRGIRADRLFALRDPEGKLGSGKNTRRFRRMAGLLGLRARLDGDVPIVELPDGRVLRGDDPEIDAALGRLLGREVTLAREAATPHLDAGPVHLVTSSALRWLAALSPDSRIDPRRFRPNILIETAALPPGLPEQELLGRVLALGDAVRLRLTAPTERCVMITQAQEELGDDPRILRALAERNEANFGVYAEVVTPGRIAVGDAVTLVGR